MFILSAMFARKIHCIRSGSYSVIFNIEKLISVRYALLRGLEVSEDDLHLLPISSVVVWQTRDLHL